MNMQWADGKSTDFLFDEVNGNDIDWVMSVSGNVEKGKKKQNHDHVFETSYFLN